MFLYWFGFMAYQPLQVNESQIHFYTQTVLFQAIQFTISTQSSSIWFIDGIFSGATKSDQCGPASNSSEGLLSFSETDLFQKIQFNMCQQS